MVSFADNGDVSCFQEEEEGECEDPHNAFPKLPYMPCNNGNWTYAMRRSMQEIVPGVFLGPYSAAMKTRLNDLLQNGITHIICVRHSVESQFIRPNFEDRFVYLILDIADTGIENIIKHFNVVREFINMTLERGGKVLVHGNAGISRSAALVLAYIMEKYGLTVKEAYGVVQQRRFCINPNEGFMAQLREFEPIYRAQKSFQNGQTSMSTTRNKRHCDEIEER